MYLKEIEMQGFKSFADKTTIEFDKGVTAVVGPNGSGKSNITESLRWALGESSAKNLRGGKMPDVIFAGAENRKPLNYAQVVVSLDNSDGFIKDAKETIRVERHIYRNGDSEYLIDGRKVRLRDIHDLFMDTGLGRDSFSVISQGRVEEIFNSKPEERRAIFEEAAGVLKYKTRKKETQTKLNQTQDNLDRLDDIIYELEAQVKPLGRQAKVAKEFIGLEDERKQLHLNVLVEDIQTDKVRLDSLKEDLDSIKSDLSAYYEQRQQFEKQNQALKTKRHQLSEEMATKQAGLVDITKAISDLERQMDLIALESSQKEEKKQAATSQLAELKASQESLREELAQKENQLAKLDGELTATTAKIQKLQAELDRFSTDPDQVIEKLREEFVSLMQEEADLSNKLTMTQADIDNQKQLSESKSEELAQTQANLEALKAEAKDALESFEAARKQVKELLDAYQELFAKTSQLEKDYQAEQTKMFDQLDVIKSKQARKSSLESILRNHSNFYAGVKSVLQASSQLGGIIGAVSEHLSFDRKYQMALEIALGGSSQHVIVEDEAAAKRSIAFLKKNRQGRATFLPLTTIKARHLSQQNQAILSSSQGFLGVASDLVSFDKRLDNIFQNLLGVTAVFDTVDNANKAARALHYQVRLVTLDGTEIRPGGSFSGGANRQNNTTFIKPELDNLVAELNELQEKQVTQEKLVQNLHETLLASKEELASLKAQGEEARFAEQKAELEYQQLAERLNDVKQLCKQLQESETDNSSNDLESQKAHFEAELTKVAEHKQELTSEIDQIKENKNAITQKVEQLRQDLSQAKLQERELLSERKFESANKTRLDISLAENKAEMTKCEDLLAFHASDQEIENLPLLKKQHDEAVTRKASEEERLVSLRFELEDCEANLEELEEQVAKENQKNEELIRKQAQVEAQVAQVSERLRGFTHDLTEDYHMTLAEAKEASQVVEDMAIARERLQDLRRRIKALGPINMDAIAQYDEVNNRLTFLNGQKEDLVHSKNLLLDTINEMDDEVKSRFQVTFNAIRESFKQTFTQMFGGGSADLSLTEGDLLIAGIEISVQPPGKKIQSLNLMSGGEKALSALALLFAIIRVKTIPFVILDEVEAALDEANVKRFGDYLNRFDKSTQFIVVTHRKGTMAAADSIYGVTMQESGISRIVSVKLKDAENLVE
ncbi:chromosome segregation protein SMC [Streptococcus lutetiensis]|uniref:chromosome segregation protein SMC n=1 Tax=Streptococcus lutetiensis TaxID=150055 RepID=UPI001BDAD95D|nr:chromosome segregation protein SMC [Streptococcus lutetiensis]MBT0897997.1 chromosome segregation protein SMC [Streptococcus lutetiensis]MBT1056867.1 chromosome segregation protein SMC [Streptococcus lutetiensis]MBT1058504.1 chromosome segregation protein SMC [Streptococcus lutetiensis]